MSNVVDAFAGSVAQDRGGDTVAQGLFAIRVQQPLGPFEADDNTNVHILFKNDTGYSLVLQSAELIPTVAVTASDTNYSSVAIAFGTAGAFVAAVTTIETSVTAGTDDWVADTPEAFVVTTTLANATLANGEYVKLTYDGTAGAAGVDLPRCTAILLFRRA
jgi:hypothetical protein